MGNVCNGEAKVLNDEDLNYISRNTALSREEVDERYAHFLERHPDGKITKKEFRNMMQVRTHPVFLSLAATRLYH